jgi:hypothetical protein
MPLRDFVLDTPWPPSVVTMEIGKHVGEARWISKGSAPFVQVYGQDRDLWFARNVAGTRAMVFGVGLSIPLVHAMIDPADGGGTRVRVEIETPMPAVALGFLLLFAGIASAASGAGVSVAVGLVAVGCAVAAKILREARWAEEEVRAIFARGGPT